MRIPIPTRQEVRVAFITAVALVLLGAGLLGWVVVHKVNESNSIVRTAATEADQISRLNEQLDAQSKSATAERAVLRAQNMTLQLEVRAGALNQRAVLRYLRNHGIKVPVNVVTLTGTGPSNRPKVPTGRQSSHQRAPGTPAPRPGTASTITDLCGLIPMPLPFLC